MTDSNKHLTIVNDSDIIFNKQRLLTIIEGE